jgi:threonine dehydrogenase-like Zn-dependent dehydrogenase
MPRKLKTFTTSAGFFDLAVAAPSTGGAETINFSTVDVYDELMSRTAKRGPDSCIDAVGCEAAGHGAADAVLDKVKAVAMLATDRVHVLRQAIMSCRKGGTLDSPASMSAWATRSRWARR